VFGPIDEFGGDMADAPHAANAAIHPAATQHLPVFITPPGETDVLMVVMAWVLIGAVIGFGVLFLRLHTLPERIAHKGHKIQFEIVAVLGLLALFTHMHIFWVIGLMLALIDIPDFGNAFKRIAGSVEKMAGFKPGEGATEPPEIAQATVDPRHDAPPPAPPPDAARPADAPRKPGIVRTGAKELGHA
jgi:hypothetical protein